VREVDGGKFHCVAQPPTTIRLHTIPLSTTNVPRRSESLLNPSPKDLWKADVSLRTRRALWPSCADTLTLTGSAADDMQSPSFAVLYDSPVSLLHRLRAAASSSGCAGISFGDDVVFGDDIRLEAFRLTVKVRLSIFLLVNPPLTNERCMHRNLQTSSWT
jgi:hypothetical protein